MSFSCTQKRNLLCVKLHHGLQKACEFCNPGKCKEHGPDFKIICYCTCCKKPRCFDCLRVRQMGSELTLVCPEPCLGAAHLNSSLPHLYLAPFIEEDSDDDEEVCVR